ncbi:leucine-rich repeat-containing protein 74B-like [Plodia interpunctella]|uniref:leucine-rich repeat-containing protein 74B-like n=1 Tax=Plodia interpunctella TaxID=58824 RepID=UPI0031013659
MSYGSSSSLYEEEQEEEVPEVQEESIPSTEDPPMSQWSSLESEYVEVNEKKILHSKGLYSPGSGEICAKTISMSDSGVLAHSYYHYPSVTDPGIKDALCAPELPTIYSDNGQDLYLSLCEEMNKFPVRLFHKNLVFEEINLRYYCVDPYSVQAMAISLQYNKYVKRLDLTENFLNDDACYHLGRMLQFNVTLKELILSGCRVKASGLASLLDNFRVNRSLTTLDLSRNELGDDGGVHFAEQLERRRVSVTNVNLSRNQLGTRTALALAEGLEFGNRLTHLDLSQNNFFQVRSTVKLLNILSFSEFMENLNLAWNGLEGIRIAEAVRRVIEIPTLKVLNLSNNRFFGEDVSIIGSGMFFAKKLKTLDFSANPLTTDDAQFLIEMMRRPRVKLRNLLLEHVNVSRDFVATLNRVKNMKSRQNFNTTYGHVINDSISTGPDAKKLILQRVAYLDARSKKHKVDILLFFLKLNKIYEETIPIKNLLGTVIAENLPLDEDLLTEMCNVFPGGKGKLKGLNLESMCDYIKRLWPEKKLPLTSEDEPAPAPLPPPKKGTSKGKGKKK